MNRNKGVRLVAAALWVFFLGGCVTTRNYVFQSVDNMVAARQYDTAEATLSGPRKTDFYSSRDGVLYNLDVGMLQHYAGHDNQSAQSLGEAERLIDDNYTKSVSKAAASFLINDYMLEYSGEEFENVYLNVFKAIDYARMNDFDGAFVEIRRMGTKLDLLEDKYGKLATSMNGSGNAKGQAKAGKTEFRDSALAHFMSILLYRADGRLDDASIEMDRLKKAFVDQPHIYDFPAPRLDGMLLPSGKARISLIGFTGRSPGKRADTLRIATLQNAIVISYDKENSSGRLQNKADVVLPFPSATSGYYFKCQLPEMVAKPSAIAKVVVMVDGARAGELALIESLENAAFATFQVKEPLIFTKTVLRTAVKGIAAGKANEEIDKQTQNQGVAGALLGILGKAATTSAIEASEQADLRCASYFPGKSWVGEFEVESGRHTVSVQYLDGSGAILYVDNLGSKDVGHDGLNLLTSYALF